MDQRFADYYSESLQAWADYQTQIWRMPIDIALERCESPIEKYMLIAMAFMDLSGPSGAGPFVNYMPGKSYDELSTITHPVDQHRIVIMPQAKVADYRVDFLLMIECYDETEARFMVVECDGHDFHERTKEQAQRDRSRDRTMQSMGITVLRFTGSEIFRDPTSCAADVMRQIKLFGDQVYERTK